MTPLENDSLKAETFVRQSLWAQGLEPPLLELAVTRCSLRHVAHNEYVCRRGEIADCWMGVASGFVKSANVAEDGRIITLTGVHAGGWFGEGALLKGEARPYDVVALRDTSLVVMPRHVFDELRHRSIAFNHFLVRQLNERLGQFIALLEIERTFEPEARVARTIAQLFNPTLYQNPGRVLDIDQQEIGLLCGMSRPRTNQALKCLEGMGLINLSYGRIHVLDLDRLSVLGDAR